MYGNRTLRKEREKIKYYFSKMPTTKNAKSVEKYCTKKLGKYGPGINTLHLIIFAARAAYQRSNLPQSAEYYRQAM